MTRQDRITAILRESYERLYGGWLCEAMAKRIDEKWDEWLLTENRDELMNYMWMNTSGGGVAEYTANRLRQEI